MNSQACDRRPDRHGFEGDNGTGHNLPRWTPVELGLLVIADAARINNMTAAALWLWHDTTLDPGTESLVS